MQLMPFDTIAQPKTRERMYPIDTMNVGQFFFLPGRARKNLASYFSHQGKRLGRKFATRTQVMRQEDGAWVEAREGEDGAVKGIGVYRTE